MEILEESNELRGQCLWGSIWHDKGAGGRSGDQLLYSTRNWDSQAQPPSFFLWDHRPGTTHAPC